MVYCNLCGSESWREHVRDGAYMCANCHSRERTRVMRMFLDQLPLDSDSRILHIAPEMGLAAYLAGVSKHYMPADIDTKRYRNIDGIQHIDLCDRASIESFGKVDLIIHSHVLEHVPCSYAAVLVNLHRMLRPNGTHMFAFPIKKSPGYSEYLGPMSHEEAETRFGQFDHVRQFSSRDLQSTLGAIFRISEQYDLREHFTSDTLKDVNVREMCWTGFTGNTVFTVKQNECLVLN